MGEKRIRPADRVCAVHVRPRMFAFVSDLRSCVTAVSCNLTRCTKIQYTFYSNECPAHHLGVSVSAAFFTRMSSAPDGHLKTLKEFPANGQVNKGGD
jgi:hypothetical protein